MKKFYQRAKITFLREPIIFSLLAALFVLSLTQHHWVTAWAMIAFTWYEVRIINLKLRVETQRYALEATALAVRALGETICNMAGRK